MSPGASLPCRSGTALPGNLSRTSQAGRSLGANMRKKVDNRIRTLVENCVKLRQRSLFVIVGDKGRDQVTCPALQALACIIKGASAVLNCFCRWCALRGAGALP